MKTQNEKNLDGFSALIDKLDARYETMMSNFKKDNKDEHKELFDLNREQSKIMNTMSVGIARIEQGLGMNKKQA